MSIIIAGLGNPGKEYEFTRHNAGFLALDYISKKLNCSGYVSKFNGVCSSAKINDESAFLIKPQTYMNLSGNCVTAVMKFYKIPPEKTILIFDDISLPVGKIRIKKKGSHGGQNGVKHILGLSGSENFPRVKIGIGNKPTPNWDLSDWVLSKFSCDEMKVLDETFEKVYLAVCMMSEGKIDKAMNMYN